MHLARDLEDERKPIATLPVIRMSCARHTARPWDFSGKFQPVWPSSHDDPCRQFTFLIAFVSSPASGGRCVGMLGGGSRPRHAVQASPYMLT